MTVAEVRYSLRGEVERVLGDVDKIEKPRPVRTARGPWARDPRAEFDWFYELPEIERAYIQRNYMSAGGIPVDVVAQGGGFDYVDDWATSFVSAVRATRARAEQARPDERVDVFDLMGPGDVAAYLGVKRNTIAQWRHRGNVRGREILPPVFAVIDGLPLWHRDEVEAWSVETGRGNFDETDEEVF